MAYEDYRDYFFKSIGKTIGSPADDWQITLENATRMNPPYGINPPPNYVQPLDSAHHGMTVMLGGGGNARGIVWLPADLPVYDNNSNAWFTHEMLVIANGPTQGTFVWAWTDRGGAPARKFTPDSTQPAPGPGPTPPPTEDYATKDEVAQMIRQALVGYIETDHDISLATMSWGSKPPMQVCSNLDQKDNPLKGNRPEGSNGDFEKFKIRQA